MRSCLGTYCNPINEKVRRHIRIASDEPLIEGVPLHDVDLLIASASLLASRITGRTRQ
jgi:hypothetical protein